MAKRHGRKKHQQIKARGRLNGGTSIRRLAERGSTMILYHYTTTVGLQKIIESKSIWAFECRFLNDASEFQHGFRFSRKYLLLTTHQTSNLSCFHSYKIFSKRVLSFACTSRRFVRIQIYFYPHSVAGTARRSKRPFPLVFNDSSKL
jgi:hypothetical protein